MESWKAAIIAGLALFSTQAMAGEIKKPGDRAMFWTTSGPTFFSSFASDVTSHPSKYFGAAKADALAFIGSEGEIRGAQFEQAPRYYHSTYSPPFMPDMQLAQVEAAERIAMDLLRPYAFDAVAAEREELEDDVDGNL